MLMVDGLGGLLLALNGGSFGFAGGRALLDPDLSNQSFFWAAPVVNTRGSSIERLLFSIRSITWSISMMVSLMVQSRRELPLHWWVVGYIYIYLY